MLGSSVEMVSWDSAPHLAVNPDGWDGYQAERRELTEHIRKHDIKDVTVLTGDIHTFIAGDVTTDGRVTGTPVATEFVGGSITSDSVGGQVGEAMAANAATNPHWKYANFARRGYGVMELSATRGEGRLPLADHDRGADRRRWRRSRRSSSSAGRPRVERTG